MLDGLELLGLPDWERVRAFNGTAVKTRADQWDILHHLIAYFPEITHYLIRPSFESSENPFDLKNQFDPVYRFLAHYGKTVYFEPANEPPRSWLPWTHQQMRALRQWYPSAIICSAPPKLTYEGPEQLSATIGQLGEDESQRVSVHVYSSDAEHWDDPAWGRVWEHWPAQGRQLVVSEIGETGQGFVPGRHERTAEMLAKMHASGIVDLAFAFIETDNPDWQHMRPTLDDCRMYAERRALRNAPQTGGGHGMDKAKALTNLDIVWGVLGQLEAKATAQLAQDGRNAVVSLKEQIEALPDPQ